MAASDLANLFGLNNKQESMDTARITSFEPGTFKPIMAGPEVAQGVAAGLFNMGNAVFGAFDNKVKETSRDDTAHATDEFLNTLQTAASMVTPDQLPLVISTFSDVLNNNPAILQDKARAALNELSARQSKFLQSAMDNETKIREAALQASSKSKDDSSKMLAEINKIWKESGEEINNFATANTSAIKDYLITSLLEDTYNENFDPGDIKTLVKNKLTELQSTVGFPMSMELQDKILDQVTTAIFNEGHYKAMANDSMYQQELTDHNDRVSSLVTSKLPGILLSGLNLEKDFSDDQQKALRKTVGEFFALNWHNIPEERANWLRTNLKSLQAKLNDAGIVNQDLQLVILNMTVGGLNIHDPEATKKFLKALDEALEDGEDLKIKNTDELKGIFDLNDSSDNSVVLSALRNTIHNSYEGKGYTGETANHAKLAANFLAAMLYSQDYRNAIKDGLKELSIQLKAEDTNFEKFKANSILSYMKGNRDKKDLSTSKLNTYNMLSGGFNSLQHQRQSAAKNIDIFLNGDGTVATANIAAATIPISGEEKEVYATSVDRYTGRRVDKSGKRFRVVSGINNFNTLAKEFSPLGDLATSIQGILPDGVTIADLVQAEEFAIGGYKDGSNFAIGFGNNIKEDKELIKKVAQYEENGDLVSLLNDSDFRTAIYKSVQGEVTKMVTAYGGGYPFDYYFRKASSDFKAEYNKLSPEDQKFIRHNINTAVFLAYYRGEGKQLKDILDGKLTKAKFDKAVFNQALREFILIPKNISLKKVQERYGGFLFGYR